MRITCTLLLEVVPQGFDQTLPGPLTCRHTTIVGAARHQGSYRKEKESALPPIQGVGQPPTQVITRPDSQRRTAIELLAKLLLVIHDSERRLALSGDSR